MNLRKLYKFAVKNYFISIFFLIILFVGFVSLYKIAFSKSTYIFAKVKLGQGFWWAGGNKPSIWLAQGIKKGDYENDLTGKKTVEVLSVKYYPYYTSDQFDVFLNLKLKVGGNTKTKKYTFKRSTIGIGSPIELELNSAQVSGTITDLSEKEFDNKTIEKTITLTKQYAYPWEYNAITIGDKYFDGENYIFEILEKNSGETVPISNLKGNIVTNVAELRKLITVKVKVRVKENSGQYILGEDQILHIGKPINISTPNFTFTDYIVGEIK